MKLSNDFVNTAYLRKEKPNQTHLAQIGFSLQSQRRN